MSDTIWKLGAFLFAAAALPVSYVVMLMVSGGFDGAPVMRFLGALLAFMIALGIAAVYRRSHGDEAGSLERFLVQLGPALAFLLLFGTVSAWFGLFSYEGGYSYYMNGPDRGLVGGMLWGTALVIAWFGYRYYKSRA